MILVDSRGYPRVQSITSRKSSKRLTSSNELGNLSLLLLLLLLLSSSSVPVFRVVFGVLVPPFLLLLVEVEVGG
jgi:hypothetical protein